MIDTRVTDIVLGRLAPKITPEFQTLIEKDMRTYFTQAGMSEEGMNVLKPDWGSLANGGKKLLFSGVENLTHADKKIFDDAFKIPKSYSRR